MEKIRNPPNKSKYFCAILYPDSSSYNTDKIILAMAEEHLTFAVSPIHDRDVDINGSPKKRHYHLLLAYSSATTLNNIRGWLNACGMPESELHSVRVCASGVGYFRYLTHKDNPEKTQYDVNDIRVFNDSDELFKKFSKTASEKIDDLARIFQIVDELNTISFHKLIQYLMLNERDLFKLLTSSSALAICVKEYQRSLEYDLKRSN
jgi:plasmid replication protein